MSTHTFSKLALILLLGATSLLAQAPRVVATGLTAPQKLILTPGGNFLVSETTREPNKGRVSFVSRGGSRRSLLDALPSGTVVTGEGSGPTAMVLRDRTLYVVIGVGDVERRGERPGSALFNPAGISSPIFSSVLAIRFDANIDAIAGTFSFTPQIQQQLADGDTVTLDGGAGTKAAVSLLADFPDAVPDANTIYRFSNPWALEASADGSTLYLADASQDSVYSIDSETGRWRKITRIPKTQNPTPVGPPVLDSVPSSVRLYGKYLLVSNLSGFPFVRDAARVWLVDPEARTSVPFIYWLTSSTDVLIRPTSGPRPQFFTLEFSLNMTAQPPAPGRLTRFDTTEAIGMSDTLVTPVSMAIDSATNSLFVLQLIGQIVEFPL
jgi:hypothetical protein